MSETTTISERPAYEVERFTIGLVVDDEDSIVLDMGLKGCESTSVIVMSKKEAAWLISGLAQVLATNKPLAFRLTAATRREGGG